LIFRPGSIIITGSRNLEQLQSAHELIIKLMEENMKSVRMEESADDNKHIALMNNEFRKISRKPRLFYIKKSNIIMD
jgi:TATA-box binding protein (TBP) (component of TFIID and TFIIIB)